MMTSDEDDGQSLLAESNSLCSMEVKPMGLLIIIIIIYSLFTKSKTHVKITVSEQN